MSKLIIDLNSILSACILVGKDPDGYMVNDELINTWEYGYDIFLVSLRRTLIDLSVVPKDIIGVLDATASRQKRQRIYPPYKTHRVARAPEYYVQFKELVAKASLFIKELGGGIITVKAMEADDVIAHIAPKLEAIIWSRDKDLLSIGAPMWLDNSLYDKATCQDKFGGIPRKYIRLYRTLVSDAGDFGPGMGAQGFGHKAFMALFTKYGEQGLNNLIDIINEGAFDELIADAEDLPRLKKIIESKENVAITWKLAAWLPIRDHQLNYDFGYVHNADCESYEEDFAEYYNTIVLVTKYNFDQMARQIRYLAGESRYITLDLETDTPPESKAWIEAIKQNFTRPPVNVDVLSSYIVGCSLTLGENSNRTFYFSVAHADTANIESKQLKDLVMSLGKPIIAHNAGGFELPVLYNNWGVMPEDVYCSLIAAKYVDENNLVGLKKLSKSWLKYIQTDYNTITGGLGMSELTAEHVLDYGADDAIMTAALFNIFEMIMDIEHTFDIYAEVEQQPMYLGARAFVNGVNVDLTALNKLKEEDKLIYDENMRIIQEYLLSTSWPGATFIPISEFSAKEIKRAYKIFHHGKILKTGFRRIDKLAKLMDDEQLSEFVSNEELEKLNFYLEENFQPDIEFKPGSPKDKKKIVYEIMGAPVRFRKMITDIQRKTGQQQGNIVTDEDAIKWAMLDVGDNEKKVLNAVLRCLNYITRKGLYYSAYPYLTHWKDGKLHPGLRQSSTTSRRYAPVGPNVNQLPKRSEEGRKIRKCIVPHKPGALIISPDFSGQELRLGAEITHDANFLSCYMGNKRKDLHSVTAFSIAQKQGNEFDSYEEFEEALRNEHHELHKLAKAYRTVKAKPTNFLSQYITIGGGIHTLSKKLQVSEADAELFLKAKAEAFPGIDIWKEARGRQIRRQGYAETMLGARKHIAALLHKLDADYVLRSALNFEIQGSGAEMLKLVLGRAEEAELIGKYDCCFYFPVHDEPCWSVDAPDIINFCKDFHPMMIHKYADMKVPLESSLGIGPNFCDLTDVPWDGVEEFLKSNNYI